MTMTDTFASSNRTITAFFDTREAADRAVSDLTQTGIPREQISIMAGADGTLTATKVEDKGFWEELKDLFLPDEDRGAYAEGLRRGGFLLTVKSAGSHYDQALDILDREGSVDMGERESSWRSEGWSGYEGAAFDNSKPVATSEAATIRSDATAVAAQPALGTSSTDRATMARASSDRTTTDRDMTVPIVEEQLQVGKRDVSHGKVRLRSYVVETPVNQQVNLRNETVEVERRPVDRALGAGEALFQDRTIEAEERSEEAVVSKSARVTEEVSLNKVASTETQNISDSVRRTEVEVDDGRKTAALGTTGTNRIGEHMDVIASDGQKVGTVDHMEGQDKIKLAKSTSPDGQHHFIPMAWVDHVDQHVHLNKPKSQVQQSW